MTARTERILIIDPDEAARADLDRYLVSRGFYVHGYGSITEARKLFDDRPPDVIFADLPPKTINELTAGLAHDGDFLPLIAFSHVTTASEVIEALRAGAVDFVLKPVTDKSAIEDVLGRLFDRVRVHRLNRLYRQELEEANTDLREGISELRADQRAGRKVQMKMLPDHNVMLNGLALDHMIKPSLYLSGDFLDYFRISDDETLIYIADVSGHGASSAFVTVLLKNLTNRLQRNLRRGSSDDILYPERFLQRINSELLDTGLGKHVTVFVGIISSSARTLRYAVGAHFPMPMISVEGGETRFLEGTGLPVGLFEEPEWEEYELSLPAPFHLFLFSDGLLEVLDAANLDKKEQQLLELVSGGRHTIASLSEALHLDEKAELPDDIALVSVTDVTVTDSDLQGVSVTDAGKKPAGAG
ncbi:PP2C family protein-serine/threonine phosphatase [Marinobacter zhanjiangensis]|uniref:Fused response regulator/phosphatase n=1 Tax=Marinobacter zhanjiangensis TaxID=578215 RepID=A0ABQ3BAI3_9GAMM|nr:SpoIIE family protein phosphatase [Marinobacter zhanjiangensis]GGY81775.1 fused response regulator/phosphatase [Marinobacter zhanjiangensis]